MKKPDRFTRIARKATDIESYSMYQDESWIPESKVAQLLRREHTWIRRMVLKVERWQAEQLADNDDVIAVILEQLNQRRK